MSQSRLHVCKICGKWFATAQGVYGHQRVHSELKRVWGRLKKKPRVCSVSTSIESKPLDAESSSFMSEIERHEMDDAAMSLVMFSEGVSVVTNLPPGDQSREEFSEVSATTCSDVVVAQALPSPLRSKSLAKRESNFSYRFKICGKSFERSLGSHQSSSNRERIECKKEESEVGNSLCDVLADSGAKKIVPQLSSLEASQEELVERRDNEHSYSDVVAQEALLIPLGSRLQEKSQSDSSYKCKVCGKSFGCFQALGGHQNLHRPISVILGRKRKRFEDDNSPSGSSSEAKKIVLQPSRFEVSQEELTECRDTNVKEHCVELKQDYETLNTCSDGLAQALPSPLGCNSRKDYRVTPATRGY